MKQGKRKLLGNKKGFSLIELIAVLMIIAILVAVGMPVYVKQVETARAADAISTIGARVGCQSLWSPLHFRTKAHRFYQ